MLSGCVVVNSAMNSAWKDSQQFIERGLILEKFVHVVVGKFELL